MIKPKVGRMFLATCVGSFFILILYFQSNSRSANQTYGEINIALKVSSLFSSEKIYLVPRVFCRGPPSWSWRPTTPDLIPQSRNSKPKSFKRALCLPLVRTDRTPNLTRRRAVLQAHLEIPQAPVTIDGEEVEVVGTYKYLGVHLDNKLDWSSNTCAVFKRGQSRLYSLRKLRSFGVRTKLLRTFYQSAVASAIFCSVVCWGNSINKTAINKLVKKAGSVIGLKLDTLEVVAEKRTLNKHLAVMDNASHPLHCAAEEQMSTFSGRLRQLRCAKERRVRSFLPTAIRLYNESPYSRNTTDLLLSELSTEQLLGRTSLPEKSRRTPLQTLYDGDQLDQSAVASVLQGRRELLDQACQSHTRKRRLLTHEDLRHLIVDDKHKLLYCYVPKVACTNWKRVLMVLTGDGRYRDPLAIPANEAHVAGRLRSLSEYTKAEINERLRTYLKFIFVREPFERLVSAYRNKFTRNYNVAFHKRYGTKIIRRHRKEEPFNEHWERVHSLCHPCLIHYDVVGKYETLEQDSQYLLKLAGADQEVQFPTFSKSTRTTGDMAAKFFDNISPFYQKKLFNLYRMDFLLFNYSTPAYLKLR
ncbi:hypothetical protein NFI96_010445 [Prochilodus magdalenae]|nr:hypothetical protein NFI96_010445 [Prochilodus magdalenae]